jgi:short-subunit dehydrogenase
MIFTVAPQGGIIMNSKEVVLITGSSTGFGRIFADNLADSRKDLIAVD